MHIFKAPHQTQSSGQFYISATLPKQKVPSIPVEEEAEWTPEPVWLCWQTEKCLPMVGNHICTSQHALKKKKKYKIYRYDYGLLPH